MPTAVPTDILIVDDTPANLEVLGLMLRDAGFKIRAAPNGARALSAMEHATPDLVLLDISMPDMDGYEVCRQMRATPRLADVPVIFLSARTNLEDKVKAFASGGVDYVTKPFQMEEVIARVRAHVSLRQTQRALSASYDKLRGLEHLRDNLVHMIVHDMRSPLAIIMGRIEVILLCEKVGLTPSVIRGLESTLVSAQNLVAMTNDLLDVSRMEEGKFPLNRAQCDLSALATETIEELRGMERGRPIMLEPGTVPPVSCDPVIIRRVLVNLINNGIKHTAVGLPLHVRLSATVGRVRIEVRDHGPGVPVESRTKIFEKFGTLESRRDPKQKRHSAGLGLAFCRLALEAHGGAIGVESAPEGGSIFWFDLPAPVTASAHPA